VIKVRGKNIIWISLALIMALNAILIGPARATMPTIIAENTAALVGDMVTINVNVADAVGVYAWQARIVFPNAQLEVLEIVEGSWLISQAPFGTLFIYRIFPGYMDVACTAIGTFNGASGSGNLFKVTFVLLEGEAGGLVNIDVTNSLLIDPFLQSLPHEEVDGVIEIQSMLPATDYAELVEKRVDSRKWDISVKGTVFTFYGKTKNWGTMDLVTRVVFAGTKDGEPFKAVTNTEIVGPQQNSGFMTCTVNFDPYVDIGTYILNCYAEYARVSAYGYRWYTSELGKTKDLSIVVLP